MSTLPEICSFVQEFNIFYYCQCIFVAIISRLEKDATLHVNNSLFSLFRIVLYLSVVEIGPGAPGKNVRISKGLQTDRRLKSNA